MNRKTFEKIWHYPDANRVLSANPYLVYALDRRGNLVVLDKTRGLKMATLDIRSFTLPYTNERDDRLYLAAQNGLLICLHDRGLRTPELLKKKEIRPEVMLEQPKKEMEPDPKMGPDPKMMPDPKKM